jgi:hypothetical protein
MLRMTYDRLVTSPLRRALRRVRRLRFDSPSGCTARDETKRLRFHMD